MGLDLVNRFSSWADYFDNIEVSGKLEKNRPVDG